MRAIFAACWVVVSSRVISRSRRVVNWDLVEKAQEDLQRPVQSSRSAPVRVIARPTDFRGWPALHYPGALGHYEPPRVAHFRIHS